LDTFAVNPKSLGFLLKSIHERELALPDFQRDFVWQPGATEALVESIAQAFPAGSLLFMSYRPDTFTPREVQNAPQLNGPPLQLVLDGQQRLTSLYQAFFGAGEYRYFIDLTYCFGEDADIEEAVFYRHHTRCGRYDTVGKQASLLVMPLGTVFGGGGFESWFDSVLDERAEQGEEKAALRKRLREANERFIKPIETYQFPVVTLEQRTSLEAVCSIFETLNKTGVRLSVFELLAARFFAKGLDLRKKWQAGRAERAIIAEFDVDEYYVLQAIALRARRSAQRADVLKLTKEQLEEHWDPVLRGFKGALEMLRADCGVLTARWLPYAYMLVPLAALWDTAIEVAGPASGANRERLKQWFWCSALNARYDRAANTQAARDFNELGRWLRGGEPPESVAEFAFDRERLRSITPRAQSVYKALMAIILRRQTLDFHHASTLSPQTIASRQIDDHHIFPRAYLNPTGEDPTYAGELVDCILNRTLIDRDTNIRISNRAPSDYLGHIQGELAKLGPAEGPADLLTRVLESHLLPAGDDSPLFADNFEGFLSWREAQLTAQIEQATGRHVVASASELGELELDAVA
jgi:hypothetical protein